MHRSIVPKENFTRGWSRIFGAAVGIVLPWIPLAAQTTFDSARVDTNVLRASHAKRDQNPWIIEHAGLAFGVAAASTIGLAALDGRTLAELSEPHVRAEEDLHQVAGDLAAFGGAGPFVASLALATVTVDEPALQSFALHNAEAIALATTLTGITKGIVGRALPDVATKHRFQFGRGFHERNGPFVSFPSGHTASAFAFASTVAGELAHDSVDHARLFGGVAFGVASGVGLARVVQRVHWPSDLPLGAFIGLWSGYAIQARANRAGMLQRAASGLNVSSDGRGRTELGWSSALGR